MDARDKPKPIGNAPMFNWDGSARLSADGSPLCRPFSLPGFENALVAAQSGKLKTQGPDGRDLPIEDLARQVQNRRTFDLFLPEKRDAMSFWRPVEVTLVTNDPVPYLIVAQRSHMTMNSRGEFQHTGGGYPQVIGTVPETLQQSAVRELLEETGLIVDPADIRNTGFRTLNNFMSFFPLPTENGKMVPGIVPEVTASLACRSDKTLSELLPLIRLGPEAIAVAAITMDTIHKLLERKPAGVDYFPSSATYAQRFIQAAKKSSAIDLAGMRIQLQNADPMPAEIKKDIRPESRGLVGFETSVPAKITCDVINDRQIAVMLKTFETAGVSLTPRATAFVADVLKKDARPHTSFASLPRSAAGSRPGEVAL